LLPKFSFKHQLFEVMEIFGVKIKGISFLTITNYQKLELKIA